MKTRADERHMTRLTPTRTWLSLALGWLLMMVGASSGWAQCPVPDLCDVSGNIGIGTATPGAKLDISAPSPELRLSSTSSSTIPQISFFDGANLGGFFQYRNSGAANPNIFTLGGYASGSQFAIFTSRTERLRIDSNGNVGIGTITPGANFEVVGAGPELRMTSNSPTTTSQLSFYDGANLVVVFQYRNSGAQSPNS